MQVIYVRLSTEQCCHADRAEPSHERSESPTRVNVNVEFSLQVEAVAFIARRRIVSASILFVTQVPPLLSSLPKPGRVYYCLLPNRGGCHVSDRWGLDGYNKIEPQKTNVKFLKITKDKSITK